MSFNDNDKDKIGKKIVGCGMIVREANEKSQRRSVNT